MERSQRSGEPAPKSLCTDGCKWARIAHPHPPLHVREDEMDEGETAVLNVSYMMDVLFNQREKTPHQSRLQCIDFLLFLFFFTKFAIKVCFIAEPSVPCSLYGYKDYIKLSISTAWKLINCIYFFKYTQISPILLTPLADLSWKRFIILSACFFWLEAIVRLWSGPARVLTYIFFDIVLCEMGILFPNKLFVWII